VNALRLSLAAALASVALSGAAQVPPDGEPLTAEAATAQVATAETVGTSDRPDVVLDVPRAVVGKLSLDVENLQARLDIDTRVVNIVQISAGVVATVQKLKMELEGVETEAHLVVRLERVANVLAKALDAIDARPELAKGGIAASVAGTALDAPRAALPSVVADAATEAARVVITPPQIAPVAAVQPVAAVAGPPAKAAAVAKPIPVAPVASVQPVVPVPGPPARAAPVATPIPVAPVASVAPVVPVVGRPTGAAPVAIPIPVAPVAAPK
jgi:hypothetical protein